jgi:hypothetical protein
MTKPDISGIAVLPGQGCPGRAFVLSRPSRPRDHVPRTRPEDIFFGVVGRRAAMIMLKDVGVDPLPKHKQDVGKGWARWDAYLDVPPSGRVGGGIFVAPGGFLNH